LKEIEKRIPGYSYFLHGSSSVPQDIVTESITTEQLKDSLASRKNSFVRHPICLCKINIDSDGRLAMTAAIRKVLTEKPYEFDPPQVPRTGQDKLKELYKHKVINVLGSDNKA
jgi:fructose-bisphosphate aldolase class II